MPSWLSYLAMASSSIAAARVTGICPRRCFSTWTWISVSQKTERLNSLPTSLQLLGRRETLVKLVSPAKTHLGGTTRSSSRSEQSWTRLATCLVSLSSSLAIILSHPSALSSKISVLSRPSLDSASLHVRYRLGRHLPRNSQRLNILPSTFRSCRLN